MYRVKWFHVASVFVLALGLAIPAMAQSVASTDSSRDPASRTFNSEQPGSVIVFPRFVRGTHSGEPNSQFEISVTCPRGLRNADGFCNVTGETPTTSTSTLGAEGYKVKLRAHWVCPSDQSFENKYICHETDFDLFTTLYGTVTFNPESITAGGSVKVPAPPCEKGYLIAWVVDLQDRPIAFDALIGDAVIRDVNGAVSAYNAIPIQAVGDVNTLIALDRNGALPFTGESHAYQQVSNSIQAPVRFEVPLRGNHEAVSTTLTLLTLDVRSNRSNNPVLVDLDVYNANESITSTFLEFICWKEIYLSDANGADSFINSNLTEAFQGTRKGLIVSGPAEKFSFADTDDKEGHVTLLGIVTTSVFDGTAYSYSYSLYHDNSTVRTTFDAN
jgi:hypothetical protein